MVTAAKITTAEKSARAEVRMPRAPAGSALAEFEQIYRSNADVVMAYFARRCAEPQMVADLTSDTFVRAAGAFGSFDPRRGTPRAWLLGIAAHVYARHCEQSANGRSAFARLAGRRALDHDEIDELATRIDAERAGGALIERCARLPALERAAVELVDLAGLTPKEAAEALGVSRVVLRKRLSRARTRLRRSTRAMSKFKDRLWRELVREHGAELAQMRRPEAQHERPVRPRLLAGSTFGLAGVATAVALLLSATTSSPAFAVSPNGDGTVTLTIKQITAITAANAKLAALGVRARAVPVVAGCRAKAGNQLSSIRLAGPFSAATASGKLPPSPRFVSLTISADRIPAGDTLILGARQSRDPWVTLVTQEMVRGTQVPVCVGGPPPFPPPFLHGALKLGACHVVTPPTLLPRGFVRQARVAARGGAGFGVIRLNAPAEPGHASRNWDSVSGNSGPPPPSGNSGPPPAVGNSGPAPATGNSGPPPPTGKSGPVMTRRGLECRLVGFRGNPGTSGNSGPPPPSGNS